MDLTAENLIPEPKPWPAMRDHERFAYFRACSAKAARFTETSAFREALAQKRESQPGLETSNGQPASQ